MPACRSIWSALGIISRLSFESSRGIPARWFSSSPGPAGKPWTVAEHLVLEQLISQGKICRQIMVGGHFPDRTWGAVDKKAKDIRRQAGKVNSRLDWTKEEDDKLRRARLDGKTWPETHAMLPSRSQNAIHYRWYHRLASGLKSQNQRAGKWTAGECEQLMRLRDEEKLPFKLISIKLGRKCSRLMDKYRCLQIKRGDIQLRLKRWTSSEIEQVHRLKKDELFSSAIAANLGRSSTVVTRIIKSGTIRRQYNHWTPEESDTLLAALRTGQKRAKIYALFPSVQPKVVDYKIHYMRMKHRSGIQRVSREPKNDGH